MLFPECVSDKDINYPLCTKDEYRHYCDNSTAWRGKAGQLRRRAIDFCIEELEDELGVA